MTAPTIAGPSPLGGGLGHAPHRFPSLVRVMTPRRIEVLRLAANGYKNAEIAKQLYLSEETVKTHMRKVHAVLGARDRAHAVALGIVRGFVLPEDVPWRQRSYEE